MNWQHPHRWDFADQSVIHNRLFGTDGLRGPGLQASWLIPVPLYLELIGSAPTPRGEIGVSFLGEHEAAKEKLAIEGVGGFPIDAAHVKGGGKDRPIQDPGDVVYMGQLVTSFEPTDTIPVVLGGDRRCLAQTQLASRTERRFTVGTSKSNGSPAGTIRNFRSCPGNPNPCIATLGLTPTVLKAELFSQTGHKG